MREEHPIDQRFRDALLSAEALPPPSVWEGVKNGRRRRRGFVFWSRRRGLAIATLFVALGAGAYWVTRDMRDVPNTPGNTYANHHAEQHTSSATSPEAPVVERTNTAPNQGLSGNATKTTAEHTPSVANKGAVRHATVQPLKSASSSGSDRANAVDAGERPVVTPVTSSGKGGGVLAAVAEPDHAAPVLVAGAVLRVAPLPAYWNPPAPTLTPVRKATPTYVLPAGEWWIAAQVGWYDVHHQWSGTNATLEQALNASEAWTSTIGVGAQVGRTWRSGVGLSIGAEHERSEQAFRYVDRWTRVDQEIMTSVVTLDTQVFVSNVDTITTMTLDERLAEGMDRRSVLRIPIEGHWRGSWRRWNYGLGLGVAAELTKATSNRVLVQDVYDGHITAAVPQGTELRDRYPTVFLGVISADVGYQLHERWTLWASPAYMHRLGAIGTNAEVFAQPERLGLRLRLSYTFNCPRTY